MFNISSYLQKAVGTIDKAVFHKQSVTNVVEKHLGVSKDKEFFDIKDGVLRTTLSPAEKMMLFMKKESLLADLVPFGVKDVR